MAAVNSWLTTYTKGKTYYDINGYVVQVTEEMIDGGFEHYSGGRPYTVEPRLTGSDLIAANIDRIEKRIKKDTEDLNGLKAAQKLLNDNPEWTTLLSLHKRGLL